MYSAVTDVVSITLLVASAATDGAQIAKLRAALVGAGLDSTARALLDDLVLEGFAEAEPADYDVTQSLGHRMPNAPAGSAWRRARQAPAAG